MFQCRMAQYTLNSQHRQLDCSPHVSALSLLAPGDRNGQPRHSGQIPDVGDGLWNQVEPHRLCDDVGAIFGAELALSLLEVRTDRLVSDAQQASGFCNLPAIRDQAQDRQLTGCERCCLAYGSTSCCRRMAANVAPMKRIARASSERH